MMKNFALVLTSILILSGCGGEASGSQESEQKVIEAETQPSQPIKSPEVWRGGKEATTAPQHTVQNAPTRTVADTPESKTTTSSPDLLGNHLWVGGKANVLTDDTEKELSSGFDWAEEPSSATKTNSFESEAKFTPTIAEEREAFLAEQAKMLEEMKALREQAEKDRLAAAAEAEAMRKKTEEENALARAEHQKEMDRMVAEAEADRLAAAKEADAMRMKAEQDNALAKAEAQKELDRLAAEAESKRVAALAEAEAIRKQAEMDEAERVAVAKKEMERMRAEAETERLAAIAEADATRAKTEKDRKAAEMTLADAAATRKEKDALEHAKAQAEADRLEAELAKEKNATASETKVAATPKSTLPSAKGSIKMAALNLEAERDGVYGVELVGEGTVENLKGQKIELAAYFYDANGKMLKDTDKINRSSKGQVYVGNDSVADSKTYTLSDKLFIPFDQLEVEGDSEQTVQVELVVWEYSHGRGKKLAASPMSKFQRAPNAVRDARLAAVKDDLSGSWRHEDGIITIIQKDGNIVVSGLGMVPYTIVSEQWTYNRGRLEGSLISKRKVPPLTRMWDFDLRISEDGDVLRGTFHRADRKGNFAFTSEPFVWTRIN